MTMQSAATEAAIPLAAKTPGSRATRRTGLWNWLGVAPFLIFSAMFLIAPTLYLFTGAFQNTAGAFTLDNIIALGRQGHWPMPIRCRSASVWSRPVSARSPA